jgi:hypothetical protein
MELHVGTSCIAEPATLYVHVFMHIKLSLIWQNVRSGACSPFFFHVRLTWNDTKHTRQVILQQTVHIFYTAPLCNINTGVWCTLSIRIMHLLFHADKLIMQVGKAHKLHSTMLLVYCHSWLSRKCSNQCSIRQSRRISNSIPVVWKIQLTTWNCKVKNSASLCYYTIKNITN